jgi:DNA polymerase-3 subunit delta'
MLNNVIKNASKHHAILLVESKLCDLNGFLKSYMKSIVSTGKDCEWCKKIDNNNYFDVIDINGCENTIKKEEILNISNQFSKIGLESRGIKFYIIRCIENATPQALNSLLMFLEEPPSDTYAILTTRAINLVMATIKSRCHIFALKSDFKIFDEVLKQFNLDKEQKKIIKKVYYSYDNIIEQLNSNFFSVAYDNAQKFIKNINDLSAIKQLQEQFVKFDYRQIKLILKILNVLTGNNEKLFRLIDDIHVNPIKILLFNNI